MRWLFSLFRGKTDPVKVVITDCSYNQFSHLYWWLREIMPNTYFEITYKKGKKLIVENLLFHFIKEMTQ